MPVPVATDALQYIMHCIFMHIYHVYNVLYFITVHCIIIALCRQTWTGAAPMIWLAKAPMELKLNKLTTPANPIDSKPANTSLRFPANTRQCDGKYLLAQIYTYDRTTNMVD